MKPLSLDSRIWSRRAATLGKMQGIFVNSSKSARSYAYGLQAKELHLDIIDAKWPELNK